MVADRIKAIREQRGLTQADLAKQLGITRSSVNAWEQGISVPSTQYIVELAGLFRVSADYLLGIDTTATVNVSGLFEDDIHVVQQLVDHLRTGRGALRRGYGAGRRRHRRSVKIFPDFREISVDKHRRMCYIYSCLSSLSIWRRSSVG